jgi:hypothetical protein
MWVFSFASTTFKRDCPFPIDAIGAFVASQLTVDVWIYFWALYSI